MFRLTSSIRRPVKRQGADQYLLFTLLSFAGSVTLTRFFLEITGYPQLGGGQLHIAHVLWGGLLLFIASILPLVTANRWVYTLGAFVSGAGVGLFIDEVGKFITQTNDYFFPLAAPIIYAFFLLTVMLYLRIRRPPTRSPRAELYRALDAFEEVLEHDLDNQERAELEKRLLYVVQNSDKPDLTRLAEDLLKFLYSESLNLAPERSSFWENLAGRWREFEAKWITRTRLKAFITGGLLGLGLFGLARMMQTLLAGAPPTNLELLIARLMLVGQLNSPGALAFFSARLTLESSVGLILLVSAALLIAGKDLPGTSFGYTGLLLSLTTVNLLVFYFEQFSTIVTAALQFLLLLALIYFRQRFATPNSRDSESGTQRKEHQAKTLP